MQASLRVNKTLHFLIIARQATISMEQNHFSLISFEQSGEQMKCRMAQETQRLTSLSKQK